MRCPSCGTKCRTSRTHCPKCNAPLDPKVAAFGGAARSVREAWGLEGREETVVVPRVRPRGRYVAFGATAAVLVVVLVVAVGIAQRSGGTPQELSLDAESFASESLAAVLAPYDTDGSGSISVAEAAAVTELDCSNLGLRSLAGIELFTNLEALDASGNALSSVDLSTLKKLAFVDLSDNALGTLSVANAKNLAYLDVSDNGLTELDLSDCTALQTLCCPGNAIARLDLSDCTALTELVCDAGQSVTVPIAPGFFPDAGLRATLAASDTDGDGALTERERNAVSALTVSDPATASLFGLAWFTNLSTLDASGTALTALYASELPKSLTSLTAVGCGIATVDLTGLGRLTTLNLSYNPLVAIDTSTLPKLTTLNLSNCALSGTLDVSLNDRLTMVDVSNNPDLQSVDITNVPGLQEAGTVICDPTCYVTIAALELIEATPSNGDEATGDMVDVALEGEGFAPEEGAAEPAL